MRFMPLQVSPEDVVRNLKTFPAGSSGGPDSLTAQHLSDLLAEAPDEQFKTNLTDFVNVVLQGDLPTEAREILFGGRLIALQKKDGGVRLIAVGYTVLQHRKKGRCTRDGCSKNARALPLRSFIAGMQPKTNLRYLYH